MTKGKLARQYFELGYNCSQAVVLAFADEIGLDIDTLAKISSSFGGGIGRMREVCGTVSGMALVLGFLYGYDSPTDNSAKKAHYDRVQTVANRFKELNGSVVCRELLGLSPITPISSTPTERTPDFYKKRPCAELAQIAGDILEEFIANQAK